MPSYFLTVRLPLFRLGGDCLEWVDEPEITYETQAHVFYETDQKVVAEHILELFSPKHPDSCFEGVFKIVSGSDVDLPQRVFYRHEIRHLGEIQPVRDWANGGLSRRLRLQMYKKARELERFVRRDLGPGENVGQEHTSPKEPVGTNSAMNAAESAKKEGRKLSKNEEISSDWVSCGYIAGIIRRRPYSIARTLRAANYPVERKANKNYCNPEHAAVLFPKWKKYWREQQKKE